MSPGTPVPPGASGEDEPIPVPQSDSVGQELGMAGHSQRAVNGFLWLEVLSGGDLIYPGVMLVWTNHWNQPGCHWSHLGDTGTLGHWPGWGRTAVSLPSCPPSTAKCHHRGDKEPGRPGQEPWALPPGPSPVPAAVQGAAHFAELWHLLNNQLVFNSHVITVLLNLNLMCIWETLI